MEHELLSPSKHSSYNTLAPSSQQDNHGEEHHNHHHHEHYIPPGWRGDMYIALEKPVVQFSLMGLLLLDVIVLIGDLLIEGQCNLGHDHWLHQVADALYWTSIAILCVFLIELILLIVCLDVRFFMNFWYDVDLVIVLAALILELVYKHSTGSVALYVEFIIILRLWRVVRIFHGMYATHQKTLDQQRERYENIIADLEDRLEAATGKSLDSFEVVH